MAQRPTSMQTSCGIYYEENRLTHHDDVSLPVNSPFLWEIVDGEDQQQLASPCTMSRNETKQADAPMWPDIFQTNKRRVNVPVTILAARNRRQQWIASCWRLRVNVVVRHVTFRGRKVPISNKFQPTSWRLSKMSIGHILGYIGWLCSDAINNRTKLRTGCGSVATISYMDRIYYTGGHCLLTQS